MNTLELFAARGRPTEFNRTVAAYGTHALLVYGYGIGKSDVFYR